MQSISGSLQSISGSSSGGGKSQMQVYQMDIRDLTAIYYKNGFDSEYNSDLAQVAKTNGILNWESDPSTYVGIGQGLRKAHVEESEFQIFLSKIDGSRKSLAFLVKDYTFLKNACFFPKVLQNVIKKFYSNEKKRSRILL